MSEESKRRLIKEPFTVPEECPEWGTWRGKRVRVRDAVKEMNRLDAQDIEVDWPGIGPMFIFQEYPVYEDDR